MPSIQIGPLSVWQHTPSTPPKARCIIIHGLGEHSGRHLNTVQHLVQSGIEVFRFDQRGCGKSAGEPQWIDSFQDYVDDSHAMFQYIKDSCNELPLFVQGHSLGGAIAIEFAAQVGPQISGLIINGAAYLPGNAVSSFKIAIGRLLNRFTPHFKIPGGIDHSAISKDPLEVEKFKNDKLCYSFNTVRQGNILLDALPLVLQSMKKFSAPLLAVHGKKDRIIRWEGTAELVKACPSLDKTLHLFENGYHEPHNDLERDEYFSLITEWILKRT